MLRTLLAVCVLAALAAADPARWIRYPVISPDGSRIAFSYRGDLWIVPAAGGDARVLTTHVGHEIYPLWSPDGKWIAFASDRHGNWDVFLVPAAGGDAERLTFHSSFDIPMDFTPDGTGVLFYSVRQDAPQAVLSSHWAPEVYTVPVGGGRPTQVWTTPMERARYSPDGARVAYQSRPGRENRWRKHHTSSVARDVWVWTPATGKHKKLTGFRGEDRNPVWAPDGETLYYLSERGGTFNVWARPADGTGAPKAVTSHGPHPVRFLSAARDGTLAYTVHGELFVRPAGGEPRRLDVRVRADARWNPVRREVFRNGATEFAVAPSGDEVAFVVRGEVFVASVEHGTTKRVTATPEQERSVSWAPDGRTLYYAGERDGAWNLYKSSLARAEEKRFYRATLLTEAPVLVGPDEAFQPVVSPDGKSVAYLHDRDEIRVLDLATNASKTLVPAAFNYSYADGDIGYVWSPDSRWLACSFADGDSRIEDIAVVELASGTVTNLTRSGYEEWAPAWSGDGTALVFYSNRLGRRAHASWGSDGDVFAMDLTRAAADRARMNDEDYAVWKEEEQERKKKERKKKKDGDEDEEKKDEPVEPVVIEFEGRDARVRRLTVHSAPLGGFALSPDGETLVHYARVGESWGLYKTDLRKKETERLLKTDGRTWDVAFAQDGESVFARRGNGTIVKVPLGKGKPEPVKFAAAMDVDAPAERRYIFEHVWRQLRAKFYEPSLHGVDWAFLKKEYAARLPDITNNHDFAELLSEMLGELNASHTGAGYRPDYEGADETAALGLLFDPAHAAAGLRVAEVLALGPADRADVTLPAGTLVTHLDGVALAPRVNPAALLNHKAGRRVLLTVRAPGEAKPRDVVLRAITAQDERELMYRRWRVSRRDKALELSGGKVGYVHVRGMNDRSFRHLYQEALGRFDTAEALIVDTRFNGGGWLHDDLVAFLGAKAYLTHHPRGKERGTMGVEPHFRWTKPVAVLVNEGNYSDAQVFPYAFQKLGIGKLVGAPVAGTGTAVWWERQIDPTIRFGIPQMGLVTDDGKYLENLEVVPDILVEETPEAQANGHDKPLESAVRHLTIR